MADDNRTLKWCTTHGDVAWLYDDNSIACFYDAVVEAISNTHALIELPEIERLRAIVATVDDLHSCRLAHDTCLACYRDWPCDTHLLIHPEEARRG